MKSFITVLIIIILLGSAHAMEDPEIVDTVRVDSVTGFPGQPIAVPVYFYNDEILSAVQLVISHDTDFLEIDTFSLEGSRFQNFNDLNIIFTDSAELVLFFIFDLFEYIPRGNGLLCTLIFNAKSTSGGNTVPLENGEWPLSPFLIKTTQFADSNATESIYPYFREGLVTISDLPPGPDSVWLDQITASPGQTIDLNIYGYNEKNLAAVDLALEISSASLIYDTTLFTGTRGDMAQSKIVNVNNIVRQILITLNYGDTSPLTPGSGPLATIRFNVAPSAGNEIVDIDSASYLGAQPLEFTLTSVDGGTPFTPYFTPGSVEIKSSTPVDDFVESTLPRQFALAQNSPNPFNPATTISFDLPRQADVTLYVYNVLGQRVKTLVEAALPAGRHKVIFDGLADDGSVLASGIYFYRIKADDFERSKKMTLVK